MDPFRTSNSDGDHVAVKGIQFTPELQGWLLSASDEDILSTLEMGAEIYRRLTDARDVETEVLNYQTTY